MGFQRESELEQVAIPFLKRMEYQYSWQVPIHNRVIDLAAITHDGFLIGVEFKLSNWKRALNQATLHTNTFDFIYVCVPGGKYLDRLLKKATEQGVGVMVYDSKIGTIKILLSAQRTNRHWRPNVEYVKEYINKRGQCET